MAIEFSTRGALNFLFKATSSLVAAFTAPWKALNISSSLRLSLFTLLLLLPSTLGSTFMLTGASAL